MAAGRPSRSGQVSTRRDRRTGAADEAAPLRPLSAPSAEPIASRRTSNAQPLGITQIAVERPPVRLDRDAPSSPPRAPPQRTYDCSSPSFQEKSRGSDAGPAAARTRSRTPSRASPTVRAGAMQGASVWITAPPAVSGHATAWSTTNASARTRSSAREDRRSAPPVRQHARRCDPGMYCSSPAAHRSPAETASRCSAARTRTHPTPVRLILMPRRRRPVRRALQDRMLERGRHLVAEQLPGDRGGVSLETACRAAPAHSSPAVHDLRERRRLRIISGVDEIELRAPRSNRRAVRTARPATRAAARPPPADVMRGRLRNPCSRNCATCSAVSTTSGFTDDIIRSGEGGGDRRRATHGCSSPIIGAARQCTENPRSPPSERRPPAPSPTGAVLACRTRRPDGIAMPERPGRAARVSPPMRVSPPASSRPARTTRRGSPARPRDRWHRGRRSPRSTSLGRQRDRRSPAAPSSARIALHRPGNSSGPRASGPVPIASCASSIRAERVSPTPRHPSTSSPDRSRHGPPGRGSQPHARERPSSSNGSRCASCTRRNYRAAHHHPKRPRVRGHRPSRRRRFARRPAPPPPPPAQGR